ncbi:hypothetical protein ACFRQM_19090 [Streptomyces sp. NPDC056831]|uniref:hypothetical protein n=1 Tax=Streptomyces sp. NPDC056831 TaxID=3345954 RepID=UPI0036B9DD51
MDRGEAALAQGVGPRVGVNLLDHDAKRRRASLVEGAQCHDGDHVVRVVSGVGVAHRVVVTVAHESVPQSPRRLIRRRRAQFGVEADGIGRTAAVDQPGLCHRGQQQRSALEIKTSLLSVPLQVDGDVLKVAGVAVGGCAVEQDVIAVLSVGGVVHSERDEHVLAHRDLTVERERHLLVGVELVQVEVDFRHAPLGGRRCGGGQRGPFCWEISAAVLGRTAMPRAGLPSWALGVW